MKEGLYAVYRRTGSQGAPMEQAIRVCGNRVEIRSGRAGEATEMLRVFRNSCLAKSPWSEMKWRRCEWLRDGYALVGYAECEDGHLRVRHRVEPAPPEAQPNDEGLSLHWGTTAPFDLRRLEDTILDTAKALRQAGLVAAARTIHVDAWCGLCIETPNRLWAIRLQPDGALTEVGEQQNAARLLKADGPAPLLALMRIERDFPGAVEFLWLEQSDAWRLEPEIRADDPYLGEAVGPFEETVRVARALGLCPAAAPLMCRQDGPAPLWF